MESMIICQAGATVTQALGNNNAFASFSEVRRLIVMGAVKLNGEPITDIDHKFFGLDRGKILTIGKREFRLFVTTNE